jgi:eukaryotic-like serine/threonine-protein kinase
MAPERWRDIEAIFGEVAALPAGERADRLTHRCNGDEGLRREVESLLAADAAGGDFLERPPVAAPSSASSARVA